MKNMKKDYFVAIKKHSIFQKDFVLGSKKYEFLIQGNLYKLLWSLDIVLVPVVICSFIYIMHVNKAKGWYDFIIYAIFCILILIGIDYLEKNFIRKYIYFSKKEIVEIKSK